MCVFVHFTLLQGELLFALCWVTCPLVTRKIGTLIAPPVEDILGGMGSSSKNYSENPEEGEWIQADKNRTCLHCTLWSDFSEALLSSQEVLVGWSAQQAGGLCGWCASRSGPVLVSTSKSKMQGAGRYLSRRMV